MPPALWLGVREYGGILHHGGGKERFEARERLGAIGESHLSALSNTLSVYGAGAMDWGVLRPAWYRGQFLEWAEEIARLWVLLVLDRHNPIRRRDWCGLVGCPYPYVTDQILAPTPEIPGPQVITENPLPTHIYDRMLYLLGGGRTCVTAKRGRWGWRRRKWMRMLVTIVRFL